MRRLTRRTVVQAGFGGGVVAASTSLSSLPATAAGGTVLSRWVGGVTPASATVAARVAGASSVRLKVGVDSGLTTGIVFSARVAPDANGNLKTRARGLRAATRYYYALEVDGVLDTAKRGTFRTSSTSAGDFTFAFGSCCNSVGATVFSEIRGHDPDLFLHLGDLHYGNIATDDRAAFRTAYDRALGSAHQGPLYANVPTVYTWSDHDYGADGSDRTSASRPAAQATYRQYVPSYALPSTTGGIYHTFTYRRIRFVVTDNRSYKSPSRNADNATKTMLGAEQKTWFKQVISSATEPVIVWVNENPWIGGARPGADFWAVYDTERTELASFLSGSGKNVAIVSGDMHALAADDGSHSPGGIPVYQAAAFNGGSSLKGGPYTVGPVPATVGTPVRQYGMVRVVDTGTQISLEFTGYQLGRTAAVSLTTTYAV